MIEHKGQHIKEELDRIESINKRYRRRNHSARIRQMAERQIQAFLGKHLITSEPSGLVF